MGKNERKELRVTIAGFGSAARSPMCPFESGYVAFNTISGEYLRWYNEKASYGIGIKDGVEFSISAIVTGKGTLQRVKIIG